MRVIIIGPPSHFPKGIEDFFRVYPDGLIQLYHPDYATLTPEVREIVSKYKVIPVDTVRPKVVECDLLLEVLDQSKKENGVWLMSDGPVDLRQCCKGLEPVVKTPEPPVINKDTKPEDYKEYLRWIRLICAVYSGYRDSLPDLGIEDAFHARDWLDQFCKMNDLWKNYVLMEYLARGNTKWETIAKEMRGYDEKQVTDHHSWMDNFRSVTPTPASSPVRAVKQADPPAREVFRKDDKGKGKERTSSKLNAWDDEFEMSKKNQEAAIVLRKLIKDDYVDSTSSKEVVDLRTEEWYKESMQFPMYLPDDMSELEERDCLAVVKMVCEMAMNYRISLPSYLEITDQVQAVYWLVQFCEFNNISFDVHGLYNSINKKESWAKIKAVKNPQVMH